LALRTGCAIVPTFCVREPDDSLRAIVLEEIEASDLADQPDGDVELTKRINAAIEQQIRAHPDQWLWLHDRWKPYASPEQEEKWARKEASDEE
jgi:KDO2-lipid IV(A) lauroyltransferase